LLAQWGKLLINASCCAVEIYRFSYCCFAEIAWSRRNLPRQTKRTEFRGGFRGMFLQHSAFREEDLEETNYNFIYDLAFRWGCKTIKWRVMGILSRRRLSAANRHGKGFLCTFLTAERRNK
jgi:hypothetical protein